MRIGSIKEDLNLEQRIAVTPEIIKKYKSLELSIILPKGYGKHLGISDQEFINEGAEILDGEEKVLSEADVVLQMNLISEKNFEKLKNETFLIGVLNPYSNKEKLNKLLDKKINCFSLELLPRITRAQSMDILSSQANLAGYKAVIDSFAYYQKAIPMMMTAAGTIPAARVLVVGAGVAGLQAIATAKRMGAIVYETDVRLASKEQVESLGAKFVFVESEESLETEGGYAKEATEDYKKKQEELMKQTVKNQDVVITTALIPGKKAPLIITEEMVLSMKPGSIICDLATSQGGNVAFSEKDKIVEKNGVKIIGYSNYASRTAYSASGLLAKNIINFLSLLVDKETKSLKIDFEDEIIKGVRI